MNNDQPVKTFLTKTLKKKAETIAHKDGMSMATYVRFLIAKDVAARSAK